MKITVTEVSVPKYKGNDEKLFEDVNLVLSQLHSLQHEYSERWKNSNKSEDLLTFMAYLHSFKLLKSTLDSHKDK